MPVLHLLAALATLAISGSRAFAEWDVRPEPQPFVQQARRVVDALGALGQPLPPRIRDGVARHLAATPSRDSADRLAAFLDTLAIARVRIEAPAGTPSASTSTGTPKARVAVSPSALGESDAPPQLQEEGWRAFLIRVENPAGFAGRLRVESPQSGPLFGGVHPFFGEGVAPEGPAPPASERPLTVETHDERPLLTRLSGLSLEYRIVLIHAMQGAGPRVAGKLRFSLIDADPSAPTSGPGAGGGAAEIASTLLPLEFAVAPAREVRLSVKEADGSPATASFLVRDELGRVHPLRAKRLAPDFFFHDPVYRADGETLRLPAGRYRFTVGRGPEYRRIEREVVVEADASPKDSGDALAREPRPPLELEFRLERWIEPRALGWFSGDHHIHAAGCLHYASPTEGVDPDVVRRHVAGEGLDVGCVLTWGMGWDHQRKFFRGAAERSATPGGPVLRYDVETSGFPNSAMGHMTLLGLREDDYPGTTRLDQWPSWNLPIAEWARSQGAAVGQAHAGWGLEAPLDAGLPNLVIPPMNGIGAHEFLVDAALGAAEFLGTHNSPAPWTLNLWYHLLSCDVRVAASGETDFPCIMGDRIGMGRTYVDLRARGEGAKKDEAGAAPKEVDYDAWLDGMRHGRSYVSDGLSHLFDFRVEVVEATADAAKGKPAPVTLARSGGELRLAGPTRLRARVRAAAFLPEAPETASRRGMRPRPVQAGEDAEVVAIADLRADEAPYWHLERARIRAEEDAGSPTERWTREVPLELVVNGRPVASRTLLADGVARDFEFDLELEESAWIAARILPSSHANPVFAILADRPVADAESARWCLDVVDRVWETKSGFVRESEREAARAAFDRAREFYREAAARARD